MSDSYLALVDPVARAETAAERAGRLRAGLIAEGIILSGTSEECTLGGAGHLPGPRLGDLYQFDEGESRPWEDLITCGVEIYDDTWVNEFGFPVFNWAKCPACDAMHEHEILEHIGQAISAFYDGEYEPLLSCSACDAASRVQGWTMDPHLGFCHVAVKFWNWPDFHSHGWKDWIPGIAARALGSPLIYTHGRV